MPEYDNKNSGLLFKKPRQSDKHPILSGFLDANGTEMDVAIWPLGDTDEGGKFTPKMDKNGAPMYSIKLREKEAATPKQVWDDKPSAPNANEPVTSDDVDGSMPF